MNKVLIASGTFRKKLDVYHYFSMVIASLLEKFHALSIFNFIDLGIILKSYSDRKEPDKIFVPLIREAEMDVTAMS